MSCQFTYVAAHSPTLPLLRLRHSLFSKPSFASPTSQALHLIHLASRLWCKFSQKLIMVVGLKFLQVLDESFTHVTAHSSTLPLLLLRHSSFSNPSVALPTSQLILKSFHCFSYVTAHSPTLSLLYLRHSSFSNPSIASPTSQLILQPFRCFTYVTAHSPTLPLLHLRHTSFSNVSVISPTSQLILQPFRRFTYVTAHSPTLPLLHYVTAHSPTLPSLYLRHSSFSNSSAASPTSQLILQPFRHFTYVIAHSPTLPSLTYITAHSPTLPLLHLRHSSFSNPFFASPTSQALHWRAAHVVMS